MTKRIERNLTWFKGPLYLYHISPKPDYSWGVIERFRFFMAEQAVEALRTHLRLLAEHKQDASVRTLMHVHAKAGDTFLVVDWRKLPVERARKVLKRPLDQICHLLKAVVKVQFGNSGTLVAHTRPESEWNVNVFPFYLYHERTGRSIAPAFFSTVGAARDAVAKHLLAQAGDKNGKKLPTKIKMQPGDTFLVLNRVQIPPGNAKSRVKSGALNHGAYDWASCLHGMIHVSRRKKPYARELPPDQCRPNTR